MASYLVFSMQKQRKIVQNKIESKIWIKYKKKKLKSNKDLANVLYTET